MKHSCWAELQDWALQKAITQRERKHQSSGQDWEQEGREAAAALQVPPDTHRVVICVQVGHKHRNEGAQDPVHVISVVTAQLPKCTFTTVQQ